MFTLTPKWLKAAIRSPQKRPQVLDRAPSESASTLGSRFQAKCNFVGSILLHPQDGIFLFISQPVSKYLLLKSCFILFIPGF